jgi:DNA modification methylase
MSEIPDASVSLILTSPGYCVGLEYEKGVTLKDHLKNLKKQCSEWNRVLMLGGIIAINFGDIHNFRTQNGGKVEIQLMGHYYQVFLRKYKIRLRDIIVWRKGKTWINNRQVSYHQKTKHTSYRILNNFEYVYILHKEGKRDVPFDIEHESKISKDEWKEWVDGVWEIPPVRRQKGHPAQFPEEIPRRLIKMCSYKGDIVLDPFGGSMTTVKVANELGRIGVGYEKEEKYKPVIMEKLGIKELDKNSENSREDSKKHPLAQVVDVVSDVVSSKNIRPGVIRSLTVPLSFNIKKDDVMIDLVSGPEEPNPPEPPRVIRADDYDEQEAAETTLKKAA